MGKSLAKKANCDFVDDIFLQNDKLADVIDFRAKKIKSTGLTSCISQFNLNSGNLSLNDELSNRKVYNIALKLAKAIDRNSSNDIKFLKNQYGTTKEFILAKDFLNRKCKQVWDVYEKNFEIENVPYEAMKTLGISNKQPLDFYLETFLKYFEKDGGTTTVDIINSLIKNPYSGYKFEDIFEYFKSNKGKFKFNQNTIAFLAEKLNYNRKELLKLGIEKSDLRIFYKNLPLLKKIQICIINIIRKRNMY